MKELLEATSRIVAGYVSNHPVSKDELSNLILSVHDTLKNVDKKTVGPTPSVDVNKSVFPHYLICLEDGTKTKLLKRYLRAKFNMTPEDYRRKWGLPSDYPMTPPSYGKLRSRIAKEMKLGVPVRRRG